MNKTHDELCQEVARLQEDLIAAETMVNAKLTAIGKGQFALVTLGKGTSPEQAAEVGEALKSRGIHGVVVNGIELRAMAAEDASAAELFGELGGEIARLETEMDIAKETVETANEQGRRLAHRLQETSDMLTEALALGEDSAERYRALKESRPTEIADAVMRARKDWAAQADPDYLRERDAEAWNAAADEVMRLTYPLAAKTFRLTASRHLKYKAEKLRQGCDEIAAGGDKA